MVKKFIAILLLLASVISFGQAIWIALKAELAQVLIARAWDDTLLSGNVEKPWRWADTWPVGRLMHANTDTDLYVLEGARGNALAFGPGRHVNSDALGKGSSVIGGHRDTHFTFLKHVKTGDIMKLQVLDGRWFHYRVSSKQIFDADDAFLPIQTGEHKLYLVTCYPFNTIETNSNLRLVVALVPTASS